MKKAISIAAIGIAAIGAALLMTPPDAQEPDGRIHQWVVPNNQWIDGAPINLHVVRIGPRFLGLSGEVIGTQIPNARLITGMHGIAFNRNTSPTTIRNLPFTDPNTGAVADWEAQRGRLVSISKGWQAGDWQGWRGFIVIEYIEQGVP
jgi:hypothetical protein